MTYEIIWTDFAITELKKIYLYYLENVSRRVAITIKDEILSSTRQLRNQPYSGQIEDHLGDLSEIYRYVLSGNYKIIYRSNNDQIFILDVFDARRNPNDLLNLERQQ